MTTWNEKVGMRRPRLDPLIGWVDEVLGFHLEPWQIKYMQRSRMRCPCQSSHSRFTVMSSEWSHTRGLMQTLEQPWER